MSALDNVLPSVRALAPYTLKATEAPTKLNQNESPFALPPELVREVLDAVAARPWNRYPDFHPVDVLAGIGALHGLPAASVLLGNGSNELIQAVFAACVGRGTPVALPSPTFSLYAMMVAANEGDVVRVPLRDDLGYDVDAWMALAREGRAHLLLCSPNNPTGSVVRDADIAALCEATPRLVIVDEAYAEFGDGDAASLVATYPNLVVLRTFSKALGLAGVRLGYALAQPELAEAIGRVKLPYNVGVFGLEVARAFLRRPEVLRGHVSALRQERARLTARLSELRVDVMAGSANFVLIRTERAQALFGWLLERGILVRDVGSYPMLAGCLRITVGTASENDAVVDAVASFFDALGEVQDA